MSLFQGSNRFNIEGGTFSSIGRDQVNIVQCSHRKEKLRTVLDEYQEISTGKVYLKRKIDESEVWRNGKLWRNLKAHRTICVARIRDEDKKEEFLHVQYSGQDAAKAWTLDFDTFSAIKNTESLQLFGYSNINSLPALVFYDALVPVSHIWERNNFSPVLFTYFSYQSSQELWLDPVSGYLRKGPFVRYSNNINYELADISSAVLNRGRPSLTLHTYSDASVLFEYLNGTLLITDIIRSICYSNQAHINYPNGEDAKSILSSLPGTVYHRTSLEFVARYPEDREIWYYEFWERISIIPDVLQGSAFSMDDGSVRFTLRPSDIGGLESLELCCDLRPLESLVDFVDSWLSQAHGVFSQLGIGEDKWGEYCTMSRFWLILERVKYHETSHTCMDISEETAIYLFIRPIPRPCDDEERWDSWLRDTKYYWSFDSSGVEEMSEHERLNLGLPAFTSVIEMFHYWWDSNAYDILEMIHRSRGSEPTSTELATSLGYTTLEVTDRKSCLEEVDDDDWSNSDMDEYITADELLCEDSDAAEGNTDDDDDDEVILYPRLNLCL